MAKKKKKKKRKKLIEKHEIAMKKNCSNMKQVTTFVLAREVLINYQNLVSRCVFQKKKKISK